MKTRVISYSEIKQHFEDILSALDQQPLNEQSIIDNGRSLLLLLGLCISQMKAPDSKPYPEKSVQLANLERANRLISYKLNTCTIDEISQQVTAAYKAFNLH